MRAFFFKTELINNVFVYEENRNNQENKKKNEDVHTKTQTLKMLYSRSRLRRAFLSSPIIWRSTQTC